MIMTSNNIIQTKLTKYECKYKENVFLVIQQVTFTGFSLCFIYSSKDFALNDRLVQKDATAYSRTY